MNNKLKELAIKAGYEPFTPIAEAFAEFSLDKFAKLIINECLREVKEEMSATSEDYHFAHNERIECANERLLTAHDNIVDLFEVNEPESAKVKPSNPVPQKPAKPKRVVIEETFNLLPPAPPKRERVEPTLQSSYVNFDAPMPPTVKKVCYQKAVNGICPLHNLFCKYPDCEE